MWNPTDLPVGASITIIGSDSGINTRTIRRILIERTHTTTYVVVGTAAKRAVYESIPSPKCAVLVADNDDSFESAMATMRGVCTRHVKRGRAGMPSDSHWNLEQLGLSMAIAFDDVKFDDDKFRHYLYCDSRAARIDYINAMLCPMQLVGTFARTQSDVVIVTSSLSTRSQAELLFRWFFKVQFETLEDFTSSLDEITAAGDAMVFVNRKPQRVARWHYT